MEPKYMQIQSLQFCPASESLSTDSPSVLIASMGAIIILQAMLQEIIMGLHLWITLKLNLISVDDVAGVVNGVDQARRGPSGEKIWSAWSSTGGESDLI